MDFDCFDILAPHTNKIRLFITESLFTKRDHPQLKKIIIFPIKLFRRYNSTLHRHVVMEMLKLINGVRT